MTSTWPVPQPISLAEESHSLLTGSSDLLLVEGISVRYRERYAVGEAYFNIRICTEGSVVINVFVEGKCSHSGLNRQRIVRICGCERIISIADLHF